MTYILDENITYLKGVGPHKAQILADEAKICTYSDLLYYFPYKYVDRTKFYKISELTDEHGFVQVTGKITNIKIIGEKRSSRLVATLYDDSGSIIMVWFKGITSMHKYLRSNTEYIVFGKPTLYQNKLNFAHPDIEEKDKHQAKPEFTFQAFYNTTEKMKRAFLNSKGVHNLVVSALKLVNNKIYETLPAYILAKNNLLKLNNAILQIHLPQNETQISQARYRFKFEELFYLQMKILYNKKQREQKVDGYKFAVVGQYFNNFYSKYRPFELTNAQKRVIREIRTDTNSGKQMNRLLQGDVGSGKTLVALMSMLLAIDNGFQACLMAPTEILANQHFITISKLIEPIGVEVGLLTGNTRKKNRQIIHNKLLNGDLKILIGTHALIEDVVVFNNIGLVIVDEQHRFGVAQRAKLWEKGKKPPHVLVMTATPIPRTLAMTLYGDLDISVIDELPPGRKPIKTQHFNDSKRLVVFGFLRKQIELGRQVYIVYPLINESEALDYKYLEDGLESISRAFMPPKYAISVLHGKMKPDEKEKSMALFVSGQTNIMIATTVIEVGVNVPNASVMVIESAERFGLSQLHQLRGRVGRGADQSYCILMTGNKLSAEARQRMQTMVQTNDGFDIAEADLKLRGPGDIEGTQQSGTIIDLKIANIARDSQIVQLARDNASFVLDNDPELKLPENQVIKKNMGLKWQAETDWGKIS